MYLCLFLPFYLETFQIKIYEIHEYKHEKKKKKTSMSLLNIFFQGQIFIFSNPFSYVLISRHFIILFKLL